MLEAAFDLPLTAAGAEQEGQPAAAVAMEEEAAQDEDQGGVGGEEAEVSVSWEDAEDGTGVLLVLRSTQK